MGPWTITTVERGDAIGVRAVRDILRSYREQLIAEVGVTTLDTELGTLPAPYVRPDGALLLARDEHGDPVGCVGVKGLSARSCEIKRLYVLPGMRSAGLGRALLRAALDQARGMGYREAYIIAVRRITDHAQRLYRSVGFEEVAPFRETPLGKDPAEFLFLGRAL